MLDAVNHIKKATKKYLRFHTRLVSLGTLLAKKGWPGNIYKVLKVY